MNLDLEILTADWERREGEISARVITGEDGSELVQLRVDLGVLQMHPDGRPDGKRYHGLPGVLDYIQHELQVGGSVADEDWRELQRELQQINYRRLAMTSLAEEALHRKDESTGRTLLQRTLRDIETCLKAVRVLQEERSANGSAVSLIATLLFNRARLAARQCVLDERIDEAIEIAETGADELEELLSETGVDAEQRDEDPGVAYLLQLARHLREQHGVEMTLREKLDDAIRREDFEAAARLRNMLNGRDPDGSNGETDTPEAAD